LETFYQVVVTKETEEMAAVKKIISGGQTGADQGGLEAGKHLSLEIGGYAPYNWLTESGPMRKLLSDYFGLTETLYDPRGKYQRRTELNVAHSDGTVIFGNKESPGSRLTTRCCIHYKKPLYWVGFPEQLRADSVEFFRSWLEEKEIQVLNVAGNRESKNSGIQQAVRIFLEEALQCHPGKN